MEENFPQRWISAEADELIGAGRLNARRRLATFSIRVVWAITGQFLAAAFFLGPFFVVAAARFAT